MPAATSASTRHPPDAGADRRCSMASAARAPDGSRRASRRSRPAGRRFATRSAAREPRTQRFVAPILEHLAPGSVSSSPATCSRGKPHPERYLTAAAAWAWRQADCIAIEDSSTGVTSCRNGRLTWCWSCRITSPCRGPTCISVTASWSASGSTSPRDGRPALAGPTTHRLRTAGCLRGQGPHVPAMSFNTRPVVVSRLSPAWRCLMVASLAVHAARGVQ